MEKNKIEKLEISGFGEAYCWAFQVFDSEWKKSKATYMQFPIVFQKVSVTFREKLVSGKHSSVSQIRKRNELKLNKHVHNY